MIQFIKIYKTYPSSSAIIINAFESDQTKHFAEEHEAGLHEGMIEWTHFPIFTIRR